MHLPLSREAAMDLVLGSDAFADVRGVFLCFVMIPVIERIGEWRFAGVARSGKEIGPLLDGYIHVMGMSVAEEKPAHHWLTSGMHVYSNMRDSWSFKGLPEVGDHRVIFMAEQGAPYDDTAMCVVEIPSLEGTPFEHMAPETEPPDTSEYEYEDEDEDEDEDD